MFYGRADVTGAALQLPMLRRPNKSRRSLAQRGQVPFRSISSHPGVSEGKATMLNEAASGDGWLKPRG